MDLFTKIITSIIMLIISGIMFYISLRTIGNLNRIRRGGTKLNGTLLTVREINTGMVAFYPVFKFSYEGKNYEVMSDKRYSNKKANSIGETVDIYFNPNIPERVTYGSAVSDFKDIGILFIFGVIVFVSWILLIVLA